MNRDGVIRVAEGLDADFGKPIVKAEDPLWTSAEVARALGISASTWRAYVTRGKAPEADEPDLERPSSRRLPKWRATTIAKWKATRTKTNPRFQESGGDNGDQ